MEADKKFLSVQMAAERWWLTCLVVCEGGEPVTVVGNPAVLNSKVAIADFMPVTTVTRLLLTVGI
jgi:hypothetical protein